MMIADLGSEHQMVMIQIVPLTGSSNMQLRDIATHKVRKMEENKEWQIFRTLFVTLFVIAGIVLLVLSIVSAAKWMLINPATEEATETAIFTQVFALNRAVWAVCFFLLAILLKSWKSDK